LKIIFILPLIITAVLRRVSQTFICATLKIMKGAKHLLLSIIVLCIYLFFDLLYPTPVLAQCPPDLVPTPQPADGYYKCICGIGTNTCYTPQPGEGPSSYDDCYQLYNKCGEGFVPGFNKSIDLSDPEFEYFPDYCLGCPSFSGVSSCSPGCNTNNRTCITQEQFDYCHCLYFLDPDDPNLDECDEPSDVPPPPPPPTPTPNPDWGFFHCEWAEEYGMCVANLDLHNCNISEGYAPCPDYCYEFNNREECENQTNIPCMTAYECFPWLEPPGGYRIPATCEVDSNGNITRFCSEDNQLCREIVEETEDGWSCTCVVIFDPTQICYAHGGVFTLIPKPKVFCRVGSNDPNQRTDNSASGKIASAIGCIPVNNTAEFVGYLLRWSMGIAGGIAFILIVYAGFIIVTSAGSPQRVQAGKELLTAAVTGLMVLIFGAFILEFIGFTILNIPGFGG
jgi:hypothetical protein